jgi:hypothetical protein
MASVVQGGTVQEKIARLRSTLGRSSRKWSIPRERILNAFLAQDHVTVHEAPWPTQYQWSAGLVQHDLSNNEHAL